MTWRDCVGQDKTVSLVEAAGRIDLQDRQPQYRWCGLCIANQALQQPAPEALVLVGRQQIKLVEEPMIRAPLHPDQADIGAGQLNDLVECEVEIGLTQPTSISLFRIDPHARFRHVQGELRVAAGRRAQGNVVHGFPREQILWWRWIPPRICCKYNPKAKSLGCD